MHEDTDPPQPPAKEKRGSLVGGFLLSWILFPILAFVCLAASTASAVMPLFVLSTPFLLAAVLALCGKPRTGIGVVLGYVSVIAVTLLLFKICAVRMG